MFKSHPEFSGAVRAHVIAPGRLLITADPIEEAEADPIIASFLAFLSEDMVAHPQNIQLLDESRSRKIASLVLGVTVNQDEDLGDETLI